MKQGRMFVKFGSPIEFIDVIDVAESQGEKPRAHPIGKALKNYLEACRKLLQGQYASQFADAPPHFKVPCNIIIIFCNDGIFVRYDASSDEGKACVIKMPNSLAEVAPIYSESIIHFPSNPETYKPELFHSLTLGKVDSTGKIEKEFLTVRPAIYAQNHLPAGFAVLTPPTRPPCLVSVTNEFDVEVEGVVESAPAVKKFEVQGVQNFLAQGVARLPVGWQAIEIYPLLSEDYWNPDYAKIWAEIDLQTILLQRNTNKLRLNAIDGRGATRKYYFDLFDKFVKLLEGPEEPVHQFLKAHPQLLRPAFQRCWSKVPFGETISDFVFEEAYLDYELVEIEAPHRKLFRKDGQPRYELNHAINQISDWIQYIQDNKGIVENDLGLKGISTNPRILVVIGRSDSLTAENRRKIETMQSVTSKLRILTYDDLLITAKTTVERIVGPLDIRGHNLELYYFQ